ncbi:hypothetical protein Tco_0945660 [Tanacetum coccineum]
MTFRNFVVAGNDKDLSFITRDPNKGDHGVGSPSVSVNNELVEALPAQPMASANPSRVRNRKDSSSQAARSNSKRKNVAPTPQSRMTRQQMVMPSSKADKGKDSASETLEVYDDDEDALRGLTNTKELPNALACHLLIISQVTPLTWKGCLDNMEVEKLCCEAKCEEAMEDFEKNPLVTQLRDKIKSIERQLEEHQADYERLVLESIKFHR